MSKAKAICDEEIIAALLQHGTIKEAADTIGTSPRMIYDRMRSSEFRALYQSAKADIIRVAAISINSKLSDAINAVSEIMNNTEVNAAVRLQAAQTIINNAGKFADRLAQDETAVRTERDSIFDF